MKRIASALLIVCIIFSCAVYLPASVEAAQPATYSKEYNSGERGVACTSLSGTSASSYYTGNYTYDKLSDLSADNLKSSLNTLMSSTHSYKSSYNDCHYEADHTDCQNGDGSVSLIYTSYSATMDQWNGWNREHVWPQSLGGGNTTGGGADLHHVRPSDAGVNSSRGNKKYGESGTNPSEKYGSNPAVGYLGGTYNSTYFEPLDNVKGDVARICLYVYVRWGSEWGANDVTQVFESIEILLQWCELDPVDTWEMGRNEVVQGIQGNRNVFIDYPEYAWLLFGEEIPNDMLTPSGEAMNNTESGEKPTEQPTEAPTEVPTEEPTEEPTEAPPTVDEPDDTGIISCNVYFGDALRFMFTSQNKPAITYTDNKGQSVPIEVRPFMVGGEQLTVDGYPAWISESGVPAQKIDKKISVTSGGTTQTYSVLEYVYTRLYVSTNTTPEEKRTYETLIRYAQAADKALNGKTESTIGTEYLVYVTNGTIDGSVSSDLFAKNDTPFENASANVKASEGKRLVFEVCVTLDGITSSATCSLDELKDLAITGHTVVTAIEVDDTAPSEQEWTLVTDLSQLAVGDRIIIAASESDFALGTTQKSNNRDQTVITKSGNTLSSPSESVQIITLEEGKVNGTFAFRVGDAGYLYAASSSSNYLRTKSTLDANGSWSVTVNSNGIASIVSQGTYARDTLKYNKASSIFACYASTSTMQNVSIYVLTE